MTKKIAFVRKGVVPIANLRVADYLAERFPELEMEVIDMTSFFKKHIDLLLLNVLYTFKEYGKEIAQGKKRPRDCFWRTSFLYRYIKQMMVNKITAEEYAFTFQMQSLFDASTAIVPHFVYTDHTNLANLSYPIVNEKDLYIQHAQEYERQIYQNATRVFTRSHNITRSIVEDYDCDPDKVTCVYAGSNAAVHNGSYAHMDNDNFTNQNILFVGIDWERKGGPELVAAFEKVLLRHPNARLTIVGATPDLNVPNCEVVGRVPVEEIHQHFRRASIYCMPTKLEPFGIVFIEALAHKLPLVATNIGAIPDFLHHGENGYLVEAGEVDDLADALIKLLDDPAKIRKFGNMGYNIALAKYNWERVIDRMVDNIRDLAAV